MLSGPSAEDPHGANDQHNQHHRTLSEAISPGNRTPAFGAGDLELDLGIDIDPDSTNRPADGSPVTHNNAGQFAASHRQNQGSTTHNGDGSLQDSNQPTNTTSSTNPFNGQPTASSNTNIIGSASPNVNTPTMQGTSAENNKTPIHASSSQNQTPNQNQNQKGRKRVLRACDQCYHLRTKCDGHKPCSHCQDLNLECAYLRVPQKRGKASKMYLIGAKKKAELQEKQKQQQEHANDRMGSADSSAHDSSKAMFGQHPHLGVMTLGRSGTSPNGITSSPQGHGMGQNENGGMGVYQMNMHGINAPRHESVSQQSTSEFDSATSSHTVFSSFSDHQAAHQMFDNTANTGARNSEAQGTSNRKNGETGVYGAFPQLLEDIHIDSTLFEGQPILVSDHHHHHPPPNHRSASSVGISGTDPHSQNFGRPGMQHIMQTGLPVQIHHPTEHHIPPLHHPQNHLGQGHSQPQDPNQPAHHHSRQSSAANTNASNVHSPQIGAILPVDDLPHRTGSPYISGHTNDNNDSRTTPIYGDFTSPNVHYSRYPILQSVAHLLQEADIGPISLAEELLETYFDQSTHVLAYLVRRKAILHTSRPRRSSRGLILALLLVAAHHSDHPSIVGKPNGRETIIAKLIRLTIAHLGPLSDIMCQGSLDDVITLIQLATIVSASEYKGTSLRYWAMAWDLAKEIKLNYEMPDLDPETREERRRTWWLLYMVDRHLGLCYNRPLTILDSECTNLCQPLDERTWESNSDIVENNSYGSSSRGVPFTVSGQGIFGYFLPLMAILGILVDLHHLGQNPMLSGILFRPAPGSLNRNNDDSQQQTSAIGGSNTESSINVSQSEVFDMSTAHSEIRQTALALLDNYERSVATWSRVPVPSGFQSAWSDYAMQLLSVLRILACVSWDPVELMASSNTSQFAKAVACGMEGVTRIRRILQVDPDLRLMPFFFGIYLFQGSLVLLAAVDKRQYNVSQELVESCEVLVRAHEVCIVTLNTEYQRNFRRVMRATMNMLTSQFNDEEERRKQYAVLGLYRWIRGGRGLAVQ